MKQFAKSIALVIALILLCSTFLTAVSAEIKQYLRGDMDGNGVLDGIDLARMSACGMAAQSTIWTATAMQTFCCALQTV